MPAPLNAGVKAMQSAPAGTVGASSTTDLYSNRCPRSSLDAGSGGTRTAGARRWAGETQVAQPRAGRNTKIPMKNTSAPTSPRIYVACLAAYNAGILHGCWIDAEQDADAIHETVQAMLGSSPVPDAEEWAIHDYEGFGSVRLSESESFEAVSQIAAFIEKHGKVGLAALEHYSGDLEDAERAMEDYMGTYASLADYAESTMDGVEIPASVAPYVDYESMGRDMEMNGGIFTIELRFHEVLVFLNH